MLKIEMLKLNEIKKYKNNAKKHPPEQIDQIIKSIEEFGFNDPIAIDEKNVIIEGNGRCIAAEKMGLDEVPTIRISGLSDEQKKAYILIHNKLTMNSDFDLDILSDELSQISTIDMEQFDFDIETDSGTFKKIPPSEYNSLTEKFLVPPFSVFFTNKGYWQDRKREWLSLGIKSELGRSEDLIHYFEIAKLRGLSGTSIFDPVLCEIIYKWFNVENGKIFDCFAGGSVRGIVADKLGYGYLGIDLSENQIAANKINAKECGCNPNWICDDSLNADNYIDDESVDLLFTCPPYGDLEKYSDDPRDLSNMSYENFINVYNNIITISCKKIKQNRFAVIVVGDIRDKNGFYRDFISETKNIFIKNGLKLYNEIILLNAIGTAALRCKKMFNPNRKVVKVHQNVLVFYKGDPKQIKNNYVEMNFDDILESIKEEEENYENF